MENHTEEKDGSEKEKNLLSDLVPGLLLPTIITVAVGQIYDAAVFCYLQWGEYWEYQLGIGLFLWTFVSDCIEVKEISKLHGFGNIVIFFSVGYFNPILSGIAGIIWRLIWSLNQKKS